MTGLLVVAIVLAVDASNDEGSVVCFTFSIVGGSVDVTGLGDVVGSLSSEKSFIFLISTYVLSKSIYCNYTIRPTFEGCATLL